ncbi:MAG TPA: hypothetical protein VK176_03745 [Phycisphaerales bacterium]|nr:hypothetical protein [Phycisphaerales bacterium]
MRQLWIEREILGWCVEALGAASAAIELEQAPKGIDSKDEKWMQGELADALASRVVVVRERVFPHMRRAGARLSQREKCDLVLLPEGCTRLEEDRQIKATSAGVPDQAGLFTQTPLEAPQERVAGAQDAFWLEVKVLGQFEYRRGVPTPNRQYSTQLVKAVCDDLQKLVDDPLVMHGGVLVVVFCADEHVAAHDMGIALNRGVDRGLTPTGAVHGGFAIPDRIGNRWCSVWLMPVSRA